MFRRALNGLLELTSLALFEKYVDFINLYSSVPEPERLEVFRELEEALDESMITFKQYLNNKGIEQGENQLLCRMLARKFGLSEEVFETYLRRLNRGARMELSDRILEWDSFDQAKDWMERHAES